MIAMILWWFIFSKPQAKSIAGKSIEILVKNGIYEPSIISAKEGETLELHFIRYDNSPCSEFVIFEDFDISAKLPLENTQIIKVPNPKSGSYKFTCQMGMYSGKLIVE